MNHFDSVYELINRNHHTFGTHHALSEFKYKLINALASKYSRVSLHQHSVHELQILLQIEVLSIYGNYKPRSERQKEVQRLWQQRGLLERTKSNLNSVLVDKSLSFRLLVDRGYLNTTIAIIEEQISKNKQAAATVKERIPK